ncbi:MAG: hypothetical protein GTO53_12210 [Planctomycetales bacterium]|nr:hypothetical protein [Planctomycetales bacterium]
MMDYRGHTTGADVRAADGLCLINIDTDEKPSGMINRLGGKLVVTGLACAYAEGRQAAGEGGSARVVLYFNRRRYSSADCAR